MSKIEVNTITQQCGPTLTVGGGACKSVTVDATTVTLGKSGGTVSLAAGATQSGFGRTGTVDWCTTAKTAPFTGVSGKGYFVNTTCGAITVTLPATPTAGDIISVADYASTFQTNAVTLCNNGSKINGVCATAGLNTQGQSITLVYVDSTRGWKNTMDSTSNVTASAYIIATGGTVTTCGNYKIHTFTADGCFAISSLSSSPTYDKVDYLVVAGGGGGDYMGAGGAGGFRESHCSTTSGCYTASPLASATSLTVTASTYPITVGGGGAAQAASGSNSVFSTITSTGGGRGAGGSSPGPGSAQTGGSGGGGAYGSNTAGGAGNTPPTSPAQGSNGGAGYCGGGWNESGGGGGGATQAGINAPSPRAGGAGAGTAINTAAGVPGPSPTLKYFAGGGGGGHDGTTPGGSGGVGGGGTGGIAGGPGGGGPQQGTPGTINTGGGGGGISSYSSNGSGGSGIVIIRYRYQ